MSLLPGVRWSECVFARGTGAIRAPFSSTSPAVRTSAADRLLPCRTCRRRKVTYTLRNNQYSNLSVDPIGGAPKSSSRVATPTFGLHRKTCTAPSYLVGDGGNCRAMDVRSIDSALLGLRVFACATWHVAPPVGEWRARMSRSRNASSVYEREAFPALHTRRTGPSCRPSVRERIRFPAPPGATRRAVRRAREFGKSGARETGRGTCLTHVEVSERGRAV